jgi:hypothetical protein
MRGAIPSLPQYVFKAWCLMKHRDNLTFIFTYIMCHQEGLELKVNTSSSSSLFLMPFSRRRIFLLLMDSFRHLVGLLRRGISPAPRPLPTHRITQTQRNAGTHPCPEQDSNLRLLRPVKVNTLGENINTIKRNT